jgi:hypothetical protein
MNAKLITALALAAALLCGGPAFALSDGAAGAGSVLREVTYSHGGSRAGSSSSSRNFAFGAGSRPFGFARAIYAFAAHPGWSQDRGYFWNGRYYRWYRDGWYLITP